MPKVTMIYDPQKFRFDPQELTKIGDALQHLVADLMSCDDAALSPRDVDWLPLAIPEGGSFASPISFEIETFGFDWRKAKVNEEALTDFKGDVLELPPFSGKLSADMPLIWIKYVDPDGQHI